MKILKRALWTVGGLLLVVLSMGVWVASAYWNNAPLPESAELPGSARLVRDGLVAAFVLPAGGSSLALIDCGDDPAGGPLLAELARRGAGPEDVGAIFLTHGHGDHTAGCHLFPKAEVMSLSEEVGLAAGTDVSGNGWWGRLARNGPQKAARVTRTLADGQTVQVGELAVRVFAVPGHTAGSAAYLANGTLFLGDNGNHHRDGSFAGAPWPFTWSVEQNRASLGKLFERLRAEKLEVSVVAPSHSAPRPGLPDGF